MGAAAFYRLGKLCSRAPARVSLAALLCSLALCLGLLRVRVQTDPQALWVPPTSTAAREQARFNALFHPFFRVQQLIFYGADSAATDLVQRAPLLTLAEVETAIRDARVPSTRVPGVTLALDAFCYRPIRGKGCLVTSPFQYWLGNATLLRGDPDIKLTTACQTTDEALKQRAPCMDQNGVPVMRSVVFGGLSRDACHANPDPCGEPTPQAKALLVTFLLLSDPANATYTALVEEWEQRVFLAIAQRASDALRDEPFALATNLSVADAAGTPTVSSESSLGPLDAGSQADMKLTFMAQRSIADSLVVQTSQNAFVVVVSYVVMFAYVSMSLGRFRDPVHSRFGLGVTGIVIVLLSLGAAMGVSSALLRVEVTMITLEVVPFLILAIGVDNMFILTNEFDRLKVLRGLAGSSSGSGSGSDRATEALMLERVLGETLVNVGPSIVVAAVAECLAFAVGVLTRIPALASFCTVAALAVLADVALQLTWFTAALVLDAKRVRARRYDLWPFMRQTLVLAPPKPKPKPKPTNSSKRALGSRPDDESARPATTSSSSSSAGVIQTFVVKTYTPWLMKRSSKVLVLLAAGLMLALSVVGYRHLPLGLEQDMAVPTDFYLHEYFQAQTRFGEAGPLAYIVLEDAMNYTDGRVQADLNRLLDELARLDAYIQLPIFSWLHTFNQWRQMRFFLRDKIAAGQCDCPEQPMAPFAYELLAPTSSSSRRHAHAHADVTPDALFYPLVQNFTRILIDSQCCQQFGLCGAQYETDIVFTTAADTSGGSVASVSPTTTATATTPATTATTIATGIKGSRLRFQVNAMTNQTMFVNSYFYLHQATRAWSARAVSGRAFPYALYFVYYEQYTYIQGVALQSVLLALAVVFGAVFLLLERDARLSALVALCVLLLTLSQLGVVFAWNQLAPAATTSVNAVSVVNLLASVGLGVEFCVHVAHQFAFSQRHRLGVTASDHTAHALARVGASVVAGIALTKVCGIGVLAFAPSMLFRVYFFRMYMGVVVLGAFYGLALLPVLLSLVGQRRASGPDDLSSFLLSEERDDDE
ncbi:hypothetical protein PybrP1_010090 [[Pythium] brassicae (nom. inval.)]|nr:hypothetical protein PybrP1_010090 [[Pythium] brassicae (nom. inval.)]